MMDYDNFWLDALVKRKATGQLRYLRQTHRYPGARIRLGNGPTLLDFSSNDYLGLSYHPALISAAQDYAVQFGAGAGASRLVSGNLSPFEEIERKLSIAKDMEAALVFVSGVQANLTILPALLDAKVLGTSPLVYADRLNHASLIQGCIAAGVRQVRFQHNDLEHLEMLLKRDASLNRPQFIITESVFSMDGDCPDLMNLAVLADAYKAFLYIDEAHATGVLGAKGFGLASGLKNAVVVGTFSKGLGGFGAYAVGSAALREYLINKCGGIIYATAPPPAVLGTMNAALDLVPSMEAERNHLASMASRLRNSLGQAGLNAGKSSSHIVPVILGDEQGTSSVAEKLENEGYYVTPIRPPTVPVGTSRLRLAVSAMHCQDDIDSVAEKIIWLARESY